MNDEKAEVESSSSEITANGNGQSTGRPNTVMALKALASRLMREVESLNEVHTVEIHEGIDFYDEVTEFEIGLIRRALTYTRAELKLTGTLIEPSAPPNGAANDV